MALDLNSELIFVGGYFRSGTSMMQGLLCKASETGEITRETSYLRGLMEAYTMGLQRFNQNTYDFFGNDKEAFRRFNEDVLKKYLKVVESKFGDKRMVLKEPMTTSCFPELAELMPKAKFVVMTRDIRDVIASQARRAAKENKRYTRQDVNKDLEEYASMYRRLKDHEPLLKDRTIYVSFESLVKNPQEELNKVTDFLKISQVDPSDWPTKRSSSDSAGTEHEGKAVTDEPVGRHRQVLDTGLVSELERVGKQLKQNLGIECISEVIGTPGAFRINSEADNGSGFAEAPSEPQKINPPSDDDFGYIEPDR